MPNNAQRVGFDTERSRAGAFTGSFQTVVTPGGQGPLEHNPVVIVFDNQSTVVIELSVDGTNVWKTFSVGEAFVLDLRANHGIASNYTIDVGTQFYVRGTAGTGSFFISIIYSR